MIGQREYLFNFRKITEGNIIGKVLVTKDKINFYLVNPDNGKIVETGHELENISINDKILIFPGDKGSSVVQLDGLYQMAQKENKPKAFIVKEISTVLVSNAVIMEIPLIVCTDKKFYEIVNNDDFAYINTEDEKLVIKKTGK